MRREWWRARWPDLLMLLAAVITVLYWMAGVDGEILWVASGWVVLWTLWLFYSRRIWGPLGAFVVFPICLLAPTFLPNVAFLMAQDCLESRALDAFWQHEHDPKPFGGWGSTRGRCGLVRYSDLLVETRLHPADPVTGRYEDRYLIARFRGAGPTNLAFYGSHEIVYDPVADESDQCVRQPATGRCALAEDWYYYRRTGKRD